MLLVANEETSVDIYRSYLPSEAKQGDVLGLEVVVFCPALYIQLAPAERGTRRRGFQTVED